MKLRSIAVVSLASLLSLGLLSCGGSNGEGPGSSAGQTAGQSTGGTESTSATQSTTASETTVGGQSTGSTPGTSANPSTVPLSALSPFTPNQANWSTFATKPFVGGTNTAHDPDGIGWLTPASWVAARWNGEIYNPSKMTRDAFASAICPSGDQIRGIREVFYQHKPFADVKNPTKAEVDEWHRIAINHVRSLVGYTSEDRQVKPDRCMFARAQWGDERKFTTLWDAKYPGTTGSAYGPCQGSDNAHCGATFVPNLADQAAYLPAGHPGCGTGQGAEGVFNAPKSNIPWSIKWTRALCSTLRAEGFWGGHTGPWFHREDFGYSFWDSEPGNNNSIAVLRAKWTGNLMPSLYCNPADAGCDPNTTGPSR